MNHLEDAGAPLQSFPRTMSLANWPFLAFLVFLAVVLSIIPARDGNWLIVAGVFGAVMIVPLSVAVIVLVAEVVGRRSLHAIHENGIVWRKGWLRGFIPWSDVAAVKVIDRDVDGDMTRFWEIEDRYPGSSTITMSGGPCSEGSELINSKITSRRQT